MKTIRTSVKNLANLIPTFNVGKITINNLSAGKCFIDCFGSQFFGELKAYIYTSIITKDFAQRFVSRYQKVLGFSVETMNFED